MLLEVRPGAPTSVVVASSDANVFLVAPGWRRSLPTPKGSSDLRAVSVKVVFLKVPVPCASWRKLYSKRQRRRI